MTDFDAKARDMLGPRNADTGNEELPSVLPAV